MNFKTLAMSGVLVVALQTGALAQSGKPQTNEGSNPVPPPSPPASICQEDSHFSDFDFWLGEWRVTGRQDGSFAGENSISKVEGGCVVQENWTGAGGGKGMSINYYNPDTEKWRQVWIAAPGYIIDIEGGLTNGSMVLVGTILNYKQKVKHPFRGTWTPNDDGTVRQFFEQLSEKEKVWQTWFDGLYTRKDE
jgi:hypothetical protein